MSRDEGVDGVIMGTIMIMHKQMSALAQTVAATTTIARCPSPKRIKIVRSSCESHLESLGDSAEGEDRRWPRDGDGIL